MGHTIYLQPYWSYCFLRPPWPLPTILQLALPGAAPSPLELQPAQSLFSREKMFSWIYFFPQNYFWGESFLLQDILTLVESEIWANSASNRFSWEVSMQCGFSQCGFGECYPGNYSICLWRAQDGWVLAPTRFQFFFFYFLTNGFLPKISPV